MDAIKYFKLDLRISRKTLLTIIPRLHVLLLTSFLIDNSNFIVRQIKFILQNKNLIIMLCTFIIIAIGYISYLISCRIYKRKEVENNEEFTKLLKI